MHTIYILLTCGKNIYSTYIASERTRDGDWIIMTTVNRGRRIQDKGDECNNQTAVRFVALGGETLQRHNNRTNKSVVVGR